jgi:sulfotransferase family protein
MRSRYLEPVEAVLRPPVWRRPMYRAVQKMQRNLWGRAFLDVGGDHRSTLYVSGSGRSGTSWVAELLNYRNDHRYMFEPLTPPHVPSFAHFIRGQYLRPENQDASFMEPMGAMLSGRLRHHWVDRLNCVPIASRRVIKDVYANLLLKWVHTNFPGIRIVFVIRHPLAVMTSRIRLAPVDPHLRFEPDLERFLVQDALVADFIEPFVGAITDASTILEKQAFWWCIENYVPLRQFAPDEIHVVCYERLRREPEVEIPRLGAFLGREFDPSIFSKMQRRSRTTGYRSALQKGGDPVSDWTRLWSPDDIRRALQILSIFGMDELYTDGPMPRASSLTGLMRHDAYA